MRKTNVGVIAVLVIGATMLFAGNARALCPDSCEMWWTPPTTYTDNTVIESQDLPLSYVAEWDGIALPVTTQISVPVPKPYGHGVAHILKVKTITARGTEGAFSPPFPWTSPVGIPRSPAGGGVR